MFQQDHRICVLIVDNSEVRAPLGVPVNRGVLPRLAATGPRCAERGPADKGRITMTHDFEYIISDEADRTAVLENFAVTPEPEAEAGATARSDARTGALLDHGRQRPRRSGGRWLLRHWRAVLISAAAVFLAIFMLVLLLPGDGPSWPASVATVQAEITQACQNPDVAAEPSQLNFACAKDTQQVLWVFALLTSGDNAGYVDSSTGRTGLEPIQPSQGGDIAWSLNLHQPYNPTNPVDSLEVAARAINNIIAGATLTSSTGAPLVEPGLESTAANCQRYTGSSGLVTRQGFPATCAKQVSSPTGQAALVSDAFQQWMGGTPSRLASEAGVLFVNADNPGNAQVQAILAGLSAAGE
jgi:hypothetical protein